MRESEAAVLRHLERVPRCDLGSIVLCSRFWWNSLFRVGGFTFKMPKPGVCLMEAEGTA